MAEIATNFPPQTYSSSFFLNSITEDDKTVAKNNQAGNENAKDSSSGRTPPLLDCFITTRFGVCALPIILLLLIRTSANSSNIKLTVWAFGRGSFRVQFSWSEEIIRMAQLICLVFAAEFLVPLILSCATPPVQDKVRIFDTISHYQGNTLPFDAAKPGWAGSTITFSFDAISRLPKNVFLTFDSDSISKVDMSRKQIEEVDSGAFITLRCLRELKLNQNNISSLNSGVFQDLNSLISIDLSDNFIKSLSDLVFAPLFNLKLLNLARNRIEKIEVLSFTNLTNLESLIVDHNRIATLPREVFVQARKLAKLDLSFNRLFNGFEPEKLRGLTELLDLSLAGNFLDHFDPSYNFSFSGKLTSLNLSTNSLSDLNCFALTRNLKHLKLLDLNANNFVCDDLIPIVKSLKDSKIKLAERINKTKLEVDGVSCLDVAVSPRRPVETSTTSPVSSTTPEVKTSTQKNYFYEIMVKYRRIERGNDEILSSLRLLQDLTIFLFVIILLFVVFQVFMKVECCRYVGNFLRGGNSRIYYDNNDVENFRLLHR